jgi:hypothetical protein
MRKKFIMKNSNSFNAKALAVVLISTLFLVVLGWKFLSDNTQKSDSINESATTSDAAQPGLLAQPQTPENNPEKGFILNSKATHPFPEIPKNRNHISLDEDIFGPQSKEEQNWLDRHGFPNREQLAAYATASDEVLKQAVAAGDKVAQTSLDMRKLIAGDKSAEESILKSAADDGNISGILRLAGFLGSLKSEEDAKRAYAMTRVAEMLGDNKVGLTRDFMLTTPLEQSAKMQAESDALHIFAKVVDMGKARHGANAVIVDPRPLPPFDPKK